MKIFFAPKTNDYKKFFTRNVLKWVDNGKFSHSHTQTRAICMIYCDETTSKNSVINLTKSWIWERNGILLP